VEPRNQSSASNAEAREERLDRILAALVAGEGHDVLRESLTEARLEAKRHLTNLLTRRLIDDAADEIERALEARGRGAGPDRPDASSLIDGRLLAEHAAARDGQEGSLVYVYAIARSHHPYSGGIPGLIPAFEIETVANEGLLAFVSAVPAEEFGEAPLKTNLNDFEWLDDHARGHQRVIDALGDQGTIVPMRFCTLYEDVSGVHDMLVLNRSTLWQAIDRMRGRSEWGVKVYADGAAANEMEAPGPPASEDSGSGEGVAYLTKRKAQEDLKKKQDALLRRVTDEIHLSLSRSAEAALDLPPQSSDLTHDDRYMAMNRSYLVPDERTKDFLAIAEALNRDHEDRGIVVETTGPWAPYSFVRIDLTPGVADGDD
jgi:hypothetical protein